MPNDRKTVLVFTIIKFNGYYGPEEFITEFECTVKAAEDNNGLYYQPIIMNEFKWSHLPIRLLNLNHRLLLSFS